MGSLLGLQPLSKQKHRISESILFIRHLLILLYKESSVKNRKYDLYVLAVLFIIITAGFLFHPQSKSNLVKITLNKEVYGYYDLNKNQTIHINKENTLKIENHKIRMISATCPDHLCIKQGAINKKGQSIICLPHKLIVEVVSGDENQQDDQAY